MLIGITGKAGSGKDTIATLIGRMVNWSSVYHLADPVKEFARAVDPIVDVGVNPDGTVHASRLSHVIDLYGMEIAKGMPEVRRLYQRIGTEAGRGVFGDQCWINLMYDWYYSQEPFVTCIVPDVRFENEAFAVHNVSGKILRVTRPDPHDLGGNAAHASETEMEGIDADATVCNDGTINELRVKVRNVLDDWGVWKP